MAWRAPPEALNTPILPANPCGIHIQKSTRASKAPRASIPNLIPSMELVPARITSMIFLSSGSSRCLTTIALDMPLAGELSIVSSFFMYETCRHSLGVSRTDAVLNCRATSRAVERLTFNKNPPMGYITDIYDLRPYRTNGAPDRKKVRICEFDASIRFRAQKSRQNLFG